MYKAITIFFILVATNALAQETVRTKLNGKISANIQDLEGIYVVNLVTEKSAVTDKEGYFSINAMPCDTLLFSSIQLKGTKICLEQKDFQNELFFVKMQSMITQLKEVIVRRYDNINAVSLGIVPYSQKKYTPAERKLATASSGRLNPMGLDPFLNLLSGRTAMLKKELEVEKKEFYLKQLDQMFEENRFQNNLNIPPEYIKGFEYYAVENKKFIDILKSGNKITTEFLIGELAIKYNEIIACENE